jgi:SAM-dependent methyltransferase
VTDVRAPLLHGDHFSRFVRDYAEERPIQQIQILEAGCGVGRGLDLERVDRYVTGVDADSPQLHTHTRSRDDLDSWTLGDLRTVPMPPRVYDVVHASFLLERVDHTELLLDRFVASMKPGGLLLVRVRDRDSAYGFIDRTLPGWLRRLAWRWLRPPDPGAAGAPVRGDDGGPLPAVYEPTVSLRGMRWYCIMRGLVIASEHTTRESVAGFGRWSTLVGRACRLVDTLSRGRYSAAHSEIALVIRKPENRFLRVI